MGKVHLHGSIHRLRESDGTIHCICFQNLRSQYCMVVRGQVRFPPSIWVIPARISPCFACSRIVIWTGLTCSGNWGACGMNSWWRVVARLGPSIFHCLKQRQYISGLWCNRTECYIALWRSFHSNLIETQNGGGTPRDTTPCSFAALGERPGREKVGGSRKPHLSRTYPYSLPSLQIEQASPDLHNNLDVRAI